MPAQRSLVRSEGGALELLEGRPLLLFLLLASVATLSYANTFHASFHFDDTLTIFQNSQVKDFSQIWDIANQRYVGLLTFALNYRLGAERVEGYHAVNLLIHIATGWLVYCLVMRLGQTPGLRGAYPRQGVAALTALLFVVHPIQTQAVTYIVQRFTSLAAFFYVLAIVCYLQWRLADAGGRRRYAWYAGALAATLLAMKTKENTFTLPLTLLLFEWMGFASRTWRAWLPLLPFMLMLPLIPLSVPMVLAGSDVGLARETADISRLSYLFTQSRVLVTYLRLLVWPAQQNLDYDYPIYHSVFAPPVLWSGLAVLALLGLAFYLAIASVRWRLIGLGGLWFFLTLSVESSLIPIRDVIFEHRLYLPSVGPLLAASVAAAHLLARWRVLSAVAAGVVLALSVGTFARNRVWADDVTLWRDVVAKSPEKARPHASLGMASLRQGRPDIAVSELQTALRLDRTVLDPYGHLNLGVAYAQLGEMELAIQSYQSAIRLKTEFPEIHYNLGAAYAQQGRWTEAIPEYRLAIELDPGYAEAHHALGVAYLDRGQLDDAIAEVRTAIQLNANFPEAHLSLGTAYARQGRVDMAIEEYSTAIKLRPNSVEGHYNLGLIYSQRGQLDHAISEYLAVIQLSPDFVDAHRDLGDVYVQQKRLDEASTHYERVLQLREDSPEVQIALGKVYLLKGSTEQARKVLDAVRRRHPEVAVEVDALSGSARSR